MTETGSMSEDDREDPQADAGTSQKDAAKTSRIRRVLKWAGIGLALLVSAALLLALAMNQPRPETGVTGDPADELAHRVEAATGQPAWRELGAVEWNFGGRREHLWDRTRGYDRVRFGEHEVLLRVNDGTGVARRAGERLSGAVAREALSKAQSMFFNDSYWLNPFSKLFDQGVTRSLITTERGEALFIEFASGGSTPGDAYAITLDANGRPEYWEMWVSIIPIGGVGTTWDHWRDIGGGAMSAGAHEMGPVTLRLTHLRAAGTLGELEDDPFAELE
jgi:hypothetical protein